jgi:hypothetical protein
MRTDFRDRGMGSLVRATWAAPRTLRIVPRNHGKRRKRLWRLLCPIIRYLAHIARRVRRAHRRPRP